MIKKIDLNIKNSILGILMLFAFNIVTMAVDYSISGFGAAGLKFYDRVFLNETNRESYYKGKIQFDIEISNNIDAQLDFRAESPGNLVDLREFSVKLKYIDFFNIKLGQLKKPFGYEYLVKREDIITIERSYLQHRTSELGYGGRNLSIMIYNKYKPDDSIDIPVSYYLYIFKDNSQTDGIGAKIIYRLGGLDAGLSWLYQSRGGTPAVGVQGFGVELVKKSSRKIYGMEAYYTEDLYEKMRLKAAKINKTIFAGGLRFFGSYKIDIDSSFLKDIEPLINCSCFLPDTEKMGNHTIQLVSGVNFYLSKNALLKLNAELRLTKNTFNKKYTTTESNISTEFLVKW